ncbi:DUF3991 and TOPRIM domain-containing protein [Candidatus Merdisoma sp. JLR.KK006]|uniref:DUF3991 and TOPRIM domain-containing protein n=1 Tax=Candidatus Merdisoma sp. JLR.KK006 TaxID=3112626 RepID=UPI002FF3A64F
MDRRNSFTQEELAAAKSVDLTAVASSLGYTVKKIGNYHTLKEMDSIRIYNRKTWFRWSREYDRGENGGSQIDFLRVFAGMEVKEAVFWLLDFAGYQRTGGWETRNQIMEPTKEEKKKPFILPEPAENNGCLYLYLKEVRKLSGEVINYFLKSDLIYEEKRYHNIVFKGRDKTGITHFASMRGISGTNGKGFKCDVAGNDKSYGFNVRNDSSTELVVFEGAIDLMSYMDIYNDFHTNKLALGMLADAPLETFLKEHPQIRSIKFCLDNDGPGRAAAEKLMQKYDEAGYEVEDCPPPKGCKDYNLFLQKIKELSGQIGKEKRAVR